MTGPEHYREAERLIEPGEQDANEPELVLRDIAIAQVHATLALAAATAQLDAYEGPGGGSATGRSFSDSTAWDAAFGPAGTETSDGQ
jgi:hypothetical protein